MSVQDEIVDLEKRFWQTMIDRDADAGAAMVADQSIVAGAQGCATITPAMFSKMMAQGSWTLHEYSFSDIQFVQPSPDVAVIGYKVTEKLTVDDKPLEMTAADCSTWIRQNGKWLNVLHTESVLGDPFGRDRVKS